MTTNTNADWKCGNEFLPYHPGASHVEPAYRDGWNDCYRAALTTAAAVPPEGWVMVPVEPTPEIVKAIDGVMWPGASEKAYRAMLAAAPKAEPVNLKCKSTQKRLATLWGFVPTGQCPTLPKSYTGSVLTSGSHSECKVTFNFSSVAEADAWHDLITSNKAEPAEPSREQFALRALVAAGHVSQELVDQALDLPGAPKSAHQPGAAYAELARAEVDRIVYACRQAGDDSTYAVVNAALRASRGQAPAPADAAPAIVVTKLELTPEQKDSLRVKNKVFIPGARKAAPTAQVAPQPAAWPIAPDVSVDLERSDWTPEEALRWYAAGKHYDTVPNGDGTSSARILDTGEVASNALRAYEQPPSTGVEPGRLLAEHVLGMDFVTDRGLRARELARKVLAQHTTAAPQPAVQQEPVAIVTRFHDLGGEIDWAKARVIAPVGAKLYLAAPVAQGDALTQAARDVLAERQRQISAEGWTPANDDGHEPGSLSEAAGCYAMQAYGSKQLPALWPWAIAWWKPSDDPRRNLEKAGALILAEMERIDRAAARSQAKEGA